MHHWLSGLLGHFQLLLLAFACVVTSSCKSSLTTDLDGFPCDAYQRCAAGYTCDVSSNACHPTVACRDRETVCGTQCVVLKDDANNCGGCGATCTAPAHGQPACSDSRCKFTCDDGYNPCGTVCVNF